MKFLKLLNEANNALFINWRLSCDPLGLAHGLLDLIETGSWSILLGNFVLSSIFYLISVFELGLHRPFLVEFLKDKYDLQTTSYKVHRIVLRGWSLERKILCFLNEIVPLIRTKKTSNQVMCQTYCLKLPLRLGCVLLKASRLLYAAGLGVIFSFLFVTVSG